MSKTKSTRLGLAGFGSPHGQFNSGRGGVDYAMLEVLSVPPAQAGRRRSACA